MSWGKKCKINKNELSEHETNCKSKLHDSTVFSSLLNFKRMENANLILIIRASFSIEYIKYHFPSLKILSAHETLVPVELFKKLPFVHAYFII